MKKVGIYAGSFDPVHEGHLNFARQAVKLSQLDKLFFMVEPRPRRKQGVKALVHRQEMVKLAIDQEGNFGSIMLDQQKFTIDKTMPALRARFQGAELHLVMGDDVIGHLSSWPGLENLASSTRLIIGVRGGSQKLVKDRLKIIENNKGVIFNHNIFNAIMSSTSSSRIRSVIKSGKQPKNVPAPVLEYIREQNLYTQQDK